MKKLLAVVVLLMCVCKIGQAKEYPGNPDRVPSVGLTYTGVDLDGTQKYTSSGISAEQDGIFETGSIMLDLRWPFNNHWTMNVGIGGQRTHFGYDETPLLNFEEHDQTGLIYSLGIRYYIH